MATFFDLLGYFDLILEQLRQTWRYFGGILTQLTDFATIWDATREPKSLIFHWFFNDFWLFSLFTFMPMFASILGRFWEHLEPFGAILGRSWSHLGSSSGHLGPSWGHLGPIWCQLGATLVPIWGHLGPT